MTSDEIKDKINQIHAIPLKDIIEMYGGTFYNGGKQFSHPSLGYEKTPSGFIYARNGKEHWKHFKEGIGGDAIDFVQMVTGKEKIDAINSILGHENNFIINEAENKERLIREQKEKADKDRKKMFAILKNSVPLIESDLGVSYFINRKIDQAALKLQDPNIEIRVNSFKSKEGKEINNIVYLFKGKAKNNSHRFVLMKGIDKDGNKNGVKLNLGNSRPVIHQSEYNKPFIICEGIEDSLSAKELGYKNFIDLNSTSNINFLMNSMNICRKWFLNNSFEVCLDNDKAGREAIKKLKTFCNIIDPSELAGVKKYFNNVINHPGDTDNVKAIKDTLKIMGKFNDIKDCNQEELAVITRSLSILLPEDYFKDYGNTFKIKDSEYEGIIEELGLNDLNDIVLETKNDFDKVVDSLLDIKLEREVAKQR